MSKRMQRYGILGSPVEHSLSPVMHAAAFDKLGLSASYQRVRTNVEDLDARFRELRRGGFAGFNITAPLKNDVLAFVDEQDAIVSALQASNTIFLRNDVVVAANTDVLGVKRALQERKTLARCKRAVVIGGGGAARAALLALQEIGLDAIYVSTRRREVAEQISRQLSPAIAHHYSDAFPTVDIVVQATPASNSPQFCEVYSPFLQSDALLLDMVYSPLRTRFLKSGELAGAETIDGTRMLLHQGAAAFELWTGERAPVDVMDNALLGALSR